jgi:23S rRNA pseudouridine2604 synthase
MMPMLPRAAYNAPPAEHQSVPAAMSEPVRLAKRLAEQLPCSRREAEIYIEGGWVSVDGRVVEEPQFRVSNEAVMLLPGATLEEPEPVTMLFHALADTAADDAIASTIQIANHAPGDMTGIRPLKRHFTKLATALPLQAGASGLVVLTQDWRVTRKLVDNAAAVEQEYVVDLATQISADTLKKLNYRASMNGKPLPPGRVSQQTETRLRFALKGAIPGQIAFLCQSVGLPIIAMKRLRIGRVSLARMPAGEWRYLPAGERF